VAVYGDELKLPWLRAWKGQNRSKPLRHNSAESFSTDPITASCLIRVRVEAPERVFVPLKTKRSARRVYKLYSRTQERTFQRHRARGYFIGVLRAKRVRYFSVRPRNYAVRVRRRTMFTRR